MYLCLFSLLLFRCLIFVSAASPAPIRTSEIRSVQKTPSASHFETRGRSGGCCQEPRIPAKTGNLPQNSLFWGNLGCFYGFRLFYVLVSIFTVAFSVSYFCFCGQPTPLSRLWAFTYTVPPMAEVHMPQSPRTGSKGSPHRAQKFKVTS